MSGMCAICGPLQCLDAVQIAHSMPLQTEAYAGLSERHAEAEAFFNKDAFLWCNDESCEGHFGAIARFAMG